MTQEQMEMEIMMLKDRVNMLEAQNQVQEDRINVLEMRVNQLEAQG